MSFELRVSPPKEEVKEGSYQEDNMMLVAEKMTRDPIMLRIREAARCEFWCGAGGHHREPVATVGVGQSEEPSGAHNKITVALHYMMGCHLVRQNLKITKTASKL